MDYLNEINEIWSMVKNKIKQKIGNTAMELWFGDAEITSFSDDNVITLVVGSDFKKKIIIERYLSELESLFREFMGFDIKFDVVSKNSQSSVDEIKKQLIQSPSAESTL
jgi:chromosomal replication initiation ATPase DnaA